MFSDLFNLKPDAFGLDISDLSIKLAKLKKRGTGFDIVSFGESSVKPGILREGKINNEDNLATAVKKAVAGAEGEKVKSKYVIASLPEEEAFLQVIQMPRLSEEDLKAAVIYEAENYIPLPIEQVYLDSQIISPLQNHLDHYDVLLAAVPKKIVGSYFSCLEKAGLKPLALEVESMAIARALIKGGVAKSPSLLIDFGANRTGFIVFSGTTVRFTSSIPVSSQKFTEAIAKALKIDLVEAEKMKIKQGLAADKEGKEIFDALIPPLTDLTEQIKKHLSFYQSHASHEHLPPNGQGIKDIFLCGGGAKLKGMAEFLSSELKLNVELGNPLLNITAQGREIVSKMPPEKLLSYTTALGLALRGIKT